MGKYENQKDPEKVKKLLKRNAIIYTNFEKRYEKRQAFFGQERFGIPEMFREFLTHLDDHCTIDRIEKLLINQAEVEDLRRGHSFKLNTHNAEEENTSEFEEYFNINYPILDILYDENALERQNIYTEYKHKLDEPEPIGKPKKVYSSKASRKAIEDFYGQQKIFEGTYLNLPLITEKGRLGDFHGSASVVLDFFKSDDELIKYVLTLKREIQKNPMIARGLDHFLEPYNLPPSRHVSEKYHANLSGERRSTFPKIEAFFKQIRSHKENGGKGLSVRLADMLFIYDCEQYLMDTSYVKDEIDRYWHTKCPRPDHTLYSSDIFEANLKKILKEDFDKEAKTAEFKMKYGSEATEIKWLEYGLSQPKYSVKINEMLNEEWNKCSDEEKHLCYDGNITHKTYKHDLKIARDLIDKGEVSIFLYGKDLSDRTRYRGSKGIVKSEDATKTRHMEDLLNNPRA